MRVVLIHFHLNTGGVTTVVRQQTELLKALGHEVLLLSGSRPPEQWPAPIAVVPGLAYDTPETRAPDGPYETAENILQAINRVWPGRQPDLIHVHNPTLAKNRCLQAVLKRLQQADLPLLCQVHDFAEDGRPEVFFEEPYIADCHYAVVNGRDRRILIGCGLLEKGVHHLPNAIRPLKWYDEAPAPDSGHVLYPVRAIRRKNIGEAILLQQCAFPETPLVITLPPTSAADLPGYDMWRQYVARHHLPVTFEAGLHNDFQHMVTDSRFLLTTSINEGFGFSFLEAWSAGRALWGRLLPDICNDFIELGVDLAHLYPHLWIPIEWIDAQASKASWQSARKRSAQRYGMPIPRDRIEAEWLGITSGNRIDFGLLCERSQRAVIDRVMAGKKMASRDLIAFNPQLGRFGSAQVSRDLVKKNRDIVMEQFSLSGYSNRLIGIYEKVLSCPVKQRIDKGALFSAFMTPSRFSLLKWSVFDG